MTKASRSLEVILENKDVISLKKAAIKYAPAGAPKFEVLLSQETLQVSEWKRMLGKDKVTELIFFLIEDLNNYFNVSRPMNTSQMANLAIEMTETLWMIRMEEIVAFFESIKKQRYGKIYERLDPAFIWELYEQYDRERDDYCEAKQSRFKQYDPRPETGSGVGLDGLAGAIGYIKGAAKRLREIKDKENGKAK